MYKSDTHEKSRVYVDALAKLFKHDRTNFTSRLKLP